MPGDDLLTATTEVTGETIVLTLTGILDASTAHVIGDALAGIDVDRTTILDLVNLSMADSAGVDCLGEIQRRAAANGAVTMAWGARRVVREVFERTGLARRIGLV